MENKRPMQIKMGDSTFDKIQAYYIDPERFPLSETLEEIRQRWIRVVAMQLKVYPKFKIVNMLVKDYGISESQAYIDIRNAENIFGNVIKTDNEAFKSMWIEWTKDYLKRSRQKNDRKSEGKALDLLAKYGGLDSDSLEFNPEKLLVKEIQMVLPKEIQELFLAFVGKGVVDLNAFDATEVDFEEVDDKESEDEGN